MQIKFPITEKIETEIYYGLYAVYILGGHSVKANPDFHIKIENLETGEEVELTEKYLKARDFKSGRKAVMFYTFQINDYGKFRISAANYQDIEVQDSILEVFPFPFSIPHAVMSFIFGKDRKKKNLSQIEILIE